MLRQIPMYLVLAAQLALLLLSLFVSHERVLDWLLLCIATPQILMLAIWLVLGRANILLRLLVNGGVLGFWATFKTNNDFFAESFLPYLVLLLAVILGATGLMRSLGWRFEKVDSAESTHSIRRRSRIPQFSLRNVAIFVSALLAMFAINAWLGFARVVFSNKVLLATFLLTAVSAILALWATLGDGRLEIRLLIYAVIISASLIGVVITIPTFASRIKATLLVFVPVVYVVPLTFLAFRLAGYHVMRLGTEIEEE